MTLMTELNPTILIESRYMSSWYDFVNKVRLMFSKTSFKDWKIQATNQGHTGSDEQSGSEVDPLDLKHSDRNDCAIDDRRCKTGDSIELA